MSKDELCQRKTNFLSDLIPWGKQNSESLSLDNFFLWWWILKDSLFYQELKYLWYPLIFTGNLFYLNMNSGMGIMGEKKIGLVLLFFCREHVKTGLAYLLRISKNLYCLCLWCSKALWYMFAWFLFFFLFSLFLGPLAKFLF